MGNKVIGKRVLRVGSCVVENSTKLWKAPWVNNRDELGSG
jgi:hypothetical protein